MRHALRAALLAAIVSLGLAITGCEGADYPGTGTTATAGQEEHCDLPAPQLCRPSTSVDTSALTEAPTRGLVTAASFAARSFGGATPALPAAAALKPSPEQWPLPGCFGDNVTASERWWWTRTGSPSQGGLANSMQLQLHPANYCPPNTSGTISGQMYWNWLYTTPAWIPVDPAWSWWGGSAMNFQVQAPDTGKWYDFDCTFKTGTTHSWSCGFYEWSDATGWGADGTMQLY